MEYILLDKKIAPKAASDIKLISAGKVLENTVTVGQCKAPFGEVMTGVITMHVVVQQTITKSKTGNFLFVNFKPSTDFRI